MSLGGLLLEPQFAIPRRTGAVVFDIEGPTPSNIPPADEEYIQGERTNDLLITPTYVHRLCLKIVG